MESELFYLMKRAGESKIKQGAITIKFLKYAQTSQVCQCGGGGIRGRAAYIYNQSGLFPQMGLLGYERHDARL